LNTTFYRLTAPLRDPISKELDMNPQDEDAVTEALEQLRINYNMRQWRVCALLAESLAEKFRAIADENGP
jgi:hypothetical protein